MKFPITTPEKNRITGMLAHYSDEQQKLKNFIPPKKGSVDFMAFESNVRFVNDMIQRIGKRLLGEIPSWLPEYK